MKGGERLSLTRRGWANVGALWLALSIAWAPATVLASPGVQIDAGAIASAFVHPRRPVAAPPSSRSPAPLAIGSDDVMGTVVDEILYLDGLGVFPRAELLRRATADTARAMLPDLPIGAIREGAEASLVAFDRNPIEDIEALRRPTLRIQRGTLLGE